MASAGRYYGASGVTAKAAVRLSEIKDGASHTMMIAEMADRPNSWRAGKLRTRKQRPDSPMSLLPGISFGQWAGPNWNHFRSYDQDGRNQFGPCAVNCSNGASIYGFHPGGANVLFVDGSVKFLQAGLAEEIMVALVSIAEGEIVGPADYQQ
jgi:prepilin-type processing-associated H-X9-DG protein